MYVYSTFYIDTAIHLPTRQALTATTADTGMFLLNIVTDAHDSWFIKQCFSHTETTRITDAKYVQGV